jgi:hypothetical protein
MAGDGIKFTAKVRLEFFPEKVNQILNDPSGPVSQAIKGTAEAVLDAAIPLIGTKYSGHHFERGPLLSQSGSVQKVGIGSGWSVVFGHEAAFIHHNGAKPHTIGEEGKILFRNGPGIVTSSGAKKFYAKRAVNHPGSAANPFLIDAARSLGLTTTSDTRFGRLRGEKGQFTSFPPSI